jgi:hypothetical protein
VAEVVPKAGGKAEAKVAAADAEVEDAGAAAVGVAEDKVMAKADADDVVAEAVVVDSVKAAPMSNRWKTATFHANQGKGCSNFIRTDTASCGAPRTITPANGAIHLFPEQ